MKVLTTVAQDNIPDMDVNSPSFLVEPKVVNEWLDPRVKVKDLPKPVKAKHKKVKSSLGNSSLGNSSWTKRIAFYTIGFQYTVKTVSHSYTGQTW